MYNVTLLLNPPPREEDLPSLRSKFLLYVFNSTSDNFFVCIAKIYKFYNTLQHKVVKIYEKFIPEIDQDY